MNTTLSITSIATIIPCEIAWEINITQTILITLIVAAAFYIALSSITKRIHKKMDEQKASLEKQHEKEMEEAKRTMMTSVSQELLTPMTMIISPLQQMASEPLTEETRIKLQMILRSAQMMLHQINMLPAGIRPAAIHGMPNMGMPADVTNNVQAATDTPSSSIAPATNTASQTDTITNATADEEENEGTTYGIMVTHVSDKVIAAPEKPSPTLSSVDDSNAAAIIQMSEIHDKEMQDAANHRFTMLMVDDSQDMCRFVRDYFRGEYNVITARNGEDALERLKDDDGIDLVVSDITMPKMNGFELCRRIKSDLRWSHIPVILLTGIASNDGEMEGIKMGADDYITKPFNVEMLRLRVKKFIEKKEVRQKQFREKVDVMPSEITITPIDEQFIQCAIKICENHISDAEFSVEMLGQELSLSRTYLYKKLISITGKGPAEFIRTIRMKRAKQYLEQSQMQMTEIAAKLGLTSAKRLTENFKSEYGISPSEYVRRLRYERAFAVNGNNAEDAADKEVETVKQPAKDEIQEQKTTDL